MRRIVSFVLLGLGVFAVALGLMLRFYAYPQLAKVPLDQDTTSVARGDGITALVIEQKNGVPVPEIRENLSLTSTTHVTGDLTQPEVKADGDVAVYVEAIKTTDDATDIVVGASVRALCVDRHTNVAVAPCEGQYIEQQQGKRATADRNVVQQPGQSFKFPFGTEQQDYQYYDLSVREAVTARFSGEESIKGLDTYRFVMTVPPTKIGEREVPGSLIGSTEQTVKADLYYQVKRTLWVEPETGIVVVGQQEGKQELLAPGEDPGEGTTVFDGTLRFTDRTINDNVNKAEDNKAKLSLLTDWPVAMWLGGGVLIVAAVVLLLTGERPPNAYGARATGSRRPTPAPPAHAPTT